MLAGAAHGGNGLDVLAANEKNAAFWQAVEVDAAAIVLLDDFVAVAIAGTASEFGRGGEGGVSKNENRSGRRLGFACAAKQAAGIVGEGGLKNSRPGC